MSDITSNFSAHRRKGQPSCQCLVSATKASRLASLPGPCPRKAQDTQALAGHSGIRMRTRGMGKPGAHRSHGAPTPCSRCPSVFLLADSSAPAPVFPMVVACSLRVSFVQHFLSTCYVRGTAIGTRHKDSDMTRPGL